MTSIFPVHHRHNNTLSFYHYIVDFTFYNMKSICLYTFSLKFLVGIHLRLLQVVAEIVETLKQKKW